MHLFSVFFATIFSLLHFSQLAASSAAFFDTHTSGEAIVLFGGDVMLDRAIRVAAEKNGGDFLFSCMDTTLADSDLTVANLEGPITDNESVSIGSAVGSAQNFIFTFPLSSASLLKKHHIEMVSLGNNHILNFGYSGVYTTRQALEAAGVEYFGDPIDDTVAYKIINGVPLAFIGYNEFGPSGWKAAAETTVTQIAEAQTAGYVPIVFAHWGIEYEPFAVSAQRVLAHQFVDAGAKAVIGTHPHVVEDHEIYKAAPIYYSLGNFIFDQYFTEAVRHGLFVKLTFTKDGVVDIQEIPLTLNRDRTVCPS